MCERGRSMAPTRVGINTHGWAALPLLTHPSAGAPGAPGAPEAPGTPEAMVQSNQSRAIRCGAGAELVVWLFLFDASSPRFSRHRP
jgi:hypothetical protein